MTPSTERSNVNRLSAKRPSVCRFTVSLLSPAHNNVDEMMQMIPDRALNDRSHPPRIDDEDVVVGEHELC